MYLPCMIQLSPNVDRAQVRFLHLKGVALLEVCRDDIVGKPTQSRRQRPWGIKTTTLTSATIGGFIKCQSVASSTPGWSTIQIATSDRDRAIMEYEVPSSHLVANPVPARKKVAVAS